VDAGQSITCGLTSAGALKCWGTHGSGAGVGDGSTASRVNPTTVIDGGVTAFAVGSSHTCAIKAGALKCWGLNTYGQLGDGTQTTRLAPTEILASGVTMVAAGGESTCAVVGGLLKCWGRNSSGQLGDGTLTQSLSPVTTDTSAGTITSLSLGDSHGCMVKGGALRCWGHNDFGQVGNGSPSSSPVTTATTIGTGYAAVTAGGSHNCALLAASNTLKCWGANSSSNLGNGSTTDLSSPTAIDAGVSYSVTAAGGNHSCGIVLLDSNTPALPAGALKCWGSNSMGQVGDGATLFVPSIVPDVRR
jgi:alpha-tubulin suppressor-like RCC1 family protein